MSGGGVAEGIYIAAAVVAIVGPLLALARWGFKRFADDIIRRIGTPEGKDAEGKDVDLTAMNVSQLSLLSRLIDGQANVAEKVADHEVRLDDHEARLDGHDDRLAALEQATKDKA